MSKVLHKALKQQEVLKSIKKQKEDDAYWKARGELAHQNLIEGIYIVGGSTVVGLVIGFWVLVVYG